VLGHEVPVTFDAPSADDLHQQVHRELSVEAGKQGVSGEVDLMLVESGVRRVYCSCGIASAVASRSDLKRRR